MASKLMSRNSDLKRKLSSRASTSSTSDFLRIDSSNARDDFVSDGYFRNAYLERTASVDQSNAGVLLNAEINVLDAVAPISGGGTEPRRRTLDDVWREIVEGKRKEQQKQQPKEEMMMTLEDFLVQAGAVEEAAVVEVKEEALSVGVNIYENNIASSYSGSVIGIGVSGDLGEFVKGRGKRSMSLLEPLDKVAQQRQRRMIKNRESAARSRERKQAYQVELESMAVRLEEENERLLKERDELMRKRLKQLLENVIPVVEKRRPPHVLRRVRSMLW